MAGARTDEEVIGTANGDEPVGAETLSAMRSQVKFWNDRAQDFWDRRNKGVKTRLCLWDGQEYDGRIWAKNNGGRRPKPFEGASDQRVRWAETAVLNKTASSMLALAMADPRIVASGTSGERTARNLTVLLRWMILDMGAEWWRQWLALASHYYGDSPAVAMMRVEWRKEKRLDYRTVTLEELGQMWQAQSVAGIEQSGTSRPEEALRASVESFVAQLSGEGDSAGVERMLVDAFGIKPARAARVVREIRARGEAEFPVVVGTDEGPEITALRMGEDFIVPDNCRNFDRAQFWFRPDWLTEAELKTLVNEDGWDPEFVKGVIQGGDGKYLINDALNGSETTDMRKGLYQVVYVYHTAVNEDGVPAKYVSVIGGSVERTAFGRRLIRGRRGDWPSVYFQRDVRSRYLLDSFGIPELVGPAQGVAKKLRDTATDNGIIGGLPPTLAKGFSVRNQFVEPLKSIGMGFNEDFSFMNPPQFPAAAERVYDKIQAENLDFLGEARKDGDGLAAQTRKKQEVDWFLKQAWNVLRMMLELAQDNASDELLGSVTDEAGDVAGLRREDIAGRFRMTLNFNADDMDPEAVEKKLKAVGSVLLPMAGQSGIDFKVIAAHGLRMMLPGISESAIRTDEMEQSDEIEDETENLAKIRAGVMPQMNTEGVWNYAARLQWYQGLVEQNPQVFADMGPDKRAMLEEWLKALGQQAVQFGKNREVGVTGASGVESE